MRRRIVFSVAALIAVLATPGCKETWYRMAAEQSHADAQYNLGVMYANGRGVLEIRSTGTVTMSDHARMSPNRRIPNICSGLVS